MATATHAKDNLTPASNAARTDLFMQLRGELRHRSMYAALPRDRPERGVAWRGLAHGHTRQQQSQGDALQSYHLLSIESTCGKPAAFNRVGDNKRLWTSSYAVWTGGVNLLALWVVYWLADVRRAALRWLHPAMVFGTNALAVYIFSELFASLLGSVHMAAQSLQKWIYHPLAVLIPNSSVAAVTNAAFRLCLLCAGVAALSQEDFPEGLRAV